MTFEEKLDDLLGEFSIDLDNAVSNSDADKAAEKAKRAIVEAIVEEISYEDKS